MKNIQLHTAAIDNGGIRRDGGEIVAVGKGATDIALDVAKDLVARHLAAEVKADEADKGDR